VAEYYWTNKGRWIYNRVQFFRCDPLFNHTFAHSSVTKILLTRSHTVHAQQGWFAMV